MDTILDSPRPLQRAPRTPGLLLCALGAGLALVVAWAVSPFAPALSPLILAIVIGAAVANARPLPASVGPGVALVARRFLRVGIVLLGLQLSFADIARLGAPMLAVIGAIVVIGIGSGLTVGRWLGISLHHRLLIACGFSICGAAAVAAVDGVIDADESDVASSIGLVVLFGTLMIPVIPLAGRFLGLGDEQIGLWAGGSIHEVAQVVAAGGAVGGTALSLAVVVKLGRVMLLAPILALLSLRLRWIRATDHTSGASTGASGALPPVVPLFVVGFLALAALRSTGIVPAPILTAAHAAQTGCLTMAMLALGLGVRAAALRESGIRPLLLGLVTTVLVAATALAGVLIVT